MGTPVDPAPGVAIAALTAAGDAHGYPQVWGTPALRAGILDHMKQVWGAPASLEETSVLPVIGTKELVASCLASLDWGRIRPSSYQRAPIRPTGLVLSLLGPRLLPLMSLTRSMSHLTLSGLIPRPTRQVASSTLTR